MKIPSFSEERGDGDGDPEPFVWAARLPQQWQVELLKVQQQEDEDEETEEEILDRKQGSTSTAAWMPSYSRYNNKQNEDGKREK